MKKEFRKSFEGKEERGKRADGVPRFDKKEFGQRGERPFKTGKRKEEGGEKSFPKKFPERKKQDRDFGDKKETDFKPFSKRKEDGNPFGERKGKFEGKKPFKKPSQGEGVNIPYGERKGKFEDKKPFKKFSSEEGGRSSYGDDKRKFEGKRPFKKPRHEEDGRPSFEERKGKFAEKKFDKKPFDKSAERKPYRKVEEEEEITPLTKRNAGTQIDEPMMLNKYIAHSGECSRRDAAELVKQGKVRVNGELVLEPGHRVAPGDTVTLSGKKLTPQKNLVYILLNKPKDYITTTDDPQERKTVMDLVDNSGVDRLYPVGRLDRHTTGLLLMTNDGALAHKLSHPSYQIRKVYHVTLDKNLTKTDYEKIFKGVELEDGLAQVDEIAYLENRHEVGLEIHSGRNRIVRRIFESLGYVVEKLDRVIYAGLTKKNLPRGKWRFLDEKEIIFLKHFKN